MVGLEGCIMEMICVANEALGGGGGGDGKVVGDATAKAGGEGAVKGVCAANEAVGGGDSGDRKVVGDAIVGEAKA